ncbi:unnamed protein product [Urochloa humidicola]
MELAVGAMASLAPKMSKLLKEEYVLQKGLKPDIESLSRELVMMNAALVGASQVPSDQLSDLDKLWAWQVQELSYDMENVVDDIMLCRVGLKSAAAADAKLFKKIFIKLAAPVKKAKDGYQICDKVRDIKTLSNELAELLANKGRGYQSRCKHWNRHPCNQPVQGRV